MKRFKKLTIYVLVGVLLSSSVMMSYKKAEVVQASATLTLGTGALLMLGILGAYGIVYKGAVDSATGEYIWKGDRGLYPHEVEQAEEWFSNMYDNAVRNWCAQNGKDPDDWNGDDDGDGDDMDEIIEQPPLWEKLVGSSVTQDREMMKRAIKLVGAFGVICADVVSEFNKTIINEDTPLIDNATEFKLSTVYEKYPGIDISYGYTLWGCQNQQLISTFNNLLKTGDVLFTYYQGNGWYMIATDKLDNNTVCFYDQGDIVLDVGYSNSNTITYYCAQNTGTVKNYSSQICRYRNDGTPTDSNMKKVCIATGSKILYKAQNSNAIELEYPIYFSENEIGRSSYFNVDSDNRVTSPIVPNFYFPSTNKVQTLLDGLENSTGDDTGTQNAVDTFVDSLGQEETETEPDTGGNEGTGTNPDTGGQGGTGGDNEGNEDEENGMFLADLKNVFPFCIPFDLIDCFRLFNAEPETPRVEVPLHFGIVEKDYTFVIDLKDFDGVAEICRSMFLILYIVGLVMATRPLIRG